VAEKKELNARFANSNKTLASLEATVTGNDKLISRLEASTEQAKQESSQSVLERQNLISSLEKTRSTLDSLNSDVASYKEQLNEANLSVIGLKKTIDEQSSVITKLTK